MLCCVVLCCVVVVIVAAPATVSVMNCFILFICKSSIYFFTTRKPYSSWVLQNLLKKQCGTAMKPIDTEIVQPECASHVISEDRHPRLSFIRSFSIDEESTEDIYDFLMAYTSPKPDTSTDAPEGVYRDLTNLTEREEELDSDQYMPLLMDVSSSSLRLNECSGVSAGDDSMSTEVDDGEEVYDDVATSRATEIEQC